MPPKGKKGQTADKAKAGEEEREEPLQAVVGAVFARVGAVHANFLDTGRPVRDALQSLYA